jgi:hypothetical protein
MQNPRAVFATWSLKWSPAYEKKKKKKKNTHNIPVASANARLLSLSAASSEYESYVPYPGDRSSRFALVATARDGLAFVRSVIKKNRPRLFSPTSFRV